MAGWHDLLDAHLKARPHEIALRDSTGTCWSSAELDAASNGIAARLLDAGVQPGDRVAVLSGNCGPAVAAMAACSRLRAVVVPLDARLSAATTQSVLDHCRPSIVLFGTTASPEAREHARRMKARPLGGHWGRMEMARPYVANPSEDSNLAAIFYSHPSVVSPPVGPAGLMMSHESLYFAAVEFAAIAQLAPGDKVAGTLPVSIASGFTAGVLAGLSSGAEVVLETGFSAADMLGALAGGATHLLTSHPVLNAVTGLCLAQPAAFSAPGLRYIATSAPMSVAHRARVEKALGVVVQTGYVPGQAAGGVSITRRETVRDTEAGGRLYVGTEVRIGPHVPGLQEGEGVIMVRGPQVMMGYFLNGPATRQFLDPEGWLRTGDTGWLDAGGRLHVIGQD